MSDLIKTIQVLQLRYPQKSDMNLGSPANVLLGTLLSARTTDIQVLKVFPQFRQKFPTWEALVKADVSDIAKSISSIGLYHAKAKAIKGLAQRILDVFQGQVPRTMEELVSLPGVGRKTASCVLAYAFNQPAIAADTHVFRIMHRLGWSQSKTPEQVERELKALVPKKLWSEINRSLVRFGRDICVARKPQCWRCPVARWCAYEPKTLTSK